jgi:DNA repair protein RadC
VGALLPGLLPPAAAVPSRDTTAARTTPAGRPRRIGTYRLVREGLFTAPAGYGDARQPIRTPRDVFALMAPYVARELGESFWILALDAKLRTSAPTVITRGILDASLVHPREVFLAAICAHASSVVLVHNHPSGDTSPSAEDKQVTSALVAAGRLLDIPVRDHIIVGATGYTSFVEAGLLT